MSQVPRALARGRMVIICHNDLFYSPLTSLWLAIIICPSVTSSGRWRKVGNMQGPPLLAGSVQGVPRPCTPQGCPDCAWYCRTARPSSKWYCRPTHSRLCTGGIGPAVASIGAPDLLLPALQWLTWRGLWWGDIWGL